VRVLVPKWRRSLTRYVPDQSPSVLFSSRPRGDSGETRGARLLEAGKHPYPPRRVIHRVTHTHYTALEPSIQGQVVTEK